MHVENILRLTEFNKRNKTTKEYFNYKIELTRVYNCSCICFFKRSVIFYDVLSDDEVKIQKCLKG